MLSGICEKSCGKVCGKAVERFPHLHIGGGGGLKFGRKFVRFFHRWKSFAGEFPQKICSVFPCFWEGFPQFPHSLLLLLKI